MCNFDTIALSFKFFMNKKTWIFFKILLIGIITLTFVNCPEDIRKNETTENNHVVQDKYLAKVNIEGFSDDSIALKYFNWIDGTSLFGGENKISDKILLNANQINITLDSVEQPEIMELIAFGSSRGYAVRVFVTPGDSIRFKIENNKIKFFGKNASHYNYFNEMDSLGLGDPKFHGNLNTYKDDCWAIFDKQNLFLKSYIENNRDVSEDFVTKAKAEIKFRYLTNLILPNNNLGSTRKSVFKVLENRKFNETSVINFENYFDKVSLNDFKRPELINNTYFKTCLENYVRYYFVNTDAEYFSSEYFLAEKKFILENFEGDLQQLTMARLLTSYNTFNQTDNLYNLKTTIEEYKKNFTKLSYLEKIEHVESELRYIDAQLPKVVLESKILNVNGDTLQVKDIIRKDKQIKVLDFWASWCGPCINEFVEGYNSRQQLNTIYDIEWVYFSIDENRENWLNKTTELINYGIGAKNYLIIDEKSSPLINYFNVKSIPRYIILNHDLSIITANSIRPSYQVEFNKLIKNSAIRNLRDYK